MSHLSTNQLAELASLTKRQVQRVLEKGVPDLGATRTPGRHWIIPDTPAIRKWAKNHRRWKRGDEPPLIIDSDTATIKKDGTIVFNDWVTKKKWHETHLKFMPLKKHLPLLKASRQYAIARWGAKFVAESEVEMEFALGIEEKPNLNPPDKSKAIINIHGISLSFDVWHRKVRDDIETWGVNKLDLAIELLDHTARVHAELVARRDQLTKPSKRRA
jgi:hypothetical protein